jgi:hypothetical protein
MYSLAYTIEYSQLGLRVKMAHSRMRNDMLNSATDADLNSAITDVEVRSVAEVVTAALLQQPIPRGCLKQ